MTQAGQPEVDEDDLIPARMVNEVVYCPRLFWLEVVAAAFDDNRHTLLGQHAHRRVDIAGGTAVKATDGGTDVLERGTWLSSSTLGVSAKFDRVVADPAADGAVMPLDTKKGRLSTDGGLWPADEAQLVLQGLLLREAGHRVENVGVFSVAEQRRAIVPLDQPRIDRALAAVQEARRVRTLALAPPPLVDSPKCPGCSLVHVCQPDEVHYLQQADADATTDAPIRLVMPPSTEQRSVVVTSSTARLTVDGEELVLQDREQDDDGEEREVTGRLGFGRIADVAIFGRAQLSTPALHALGRAGIPVSFFSSTGFFIGTFTPALNNRVDVRIAQHKGWQGEVGLGIARVLIADKIANTRMLLRRNRVDEDDVDDVSLLRLQRLASDAKGAKDAPALLALEGEAAKRSWAGFSMMLARTDATFAMQGRTRRPPRDASNAMISYVSGMLTRECTTAASTAGLDPFLGVYHTPHHGRPSMALDLMEPFRPLLVESTVLGVIRRGEVTPKGFVRLGDAVSMDKATKKALAVAWERRLAEKVTHPVFGYQVSYRQVLTIHARLLARVLVGELSTMPSFRTR
jgi:CRISPR-associated protein Cas1